MHIVENSKNILFIIFVKKSLLSSSLICNETDSVHDKLNKLYDSMYILENLLAIEYIPLKLSPKIVDIIVLSETFTTHHEIEFGINGNEYLYISFNIFLSRLVFIFKYLYSFNLNGYYN